MCRGEGDGSDLGYSLRSLGTKGDGSVRWGKKRQRRGLEGVVASVGVKCRRDEIIVRENLLGFEAFFNCRLSPQLDLYILLDRDN